MISPVGLSANSERRGSQGKLDPSKVIDVTKFAVIMGSPARPMTVDPWLKACLKGLSPTFENKLAAVCTQGVTLQYLQNNKASIAHPEMNTYKKLLPRVKAVRGFHEWDALHELIINEVFRMHLRVFTRPGCLQSVLIRSHVYPSMQSLQTPNTSSSE
jgi:hypothetical protein